MIDNSNICVYILLFFNGKSYIGQTNNFENRIKQHPNGKTCRLLFKAIAKHGKGSYIASILHNNLTRDEANDVEEKEILERNTRAPNGYNIRNGGNYSSISEETKKLISKANTGKKRTNETIERIRQASLNMPQSQKDKISASLTGKIASDETKEKQRKKRFGTKRSIETKEKMSLSAKGKVFTDDHKLNMSKSRSGTKFFNNGIVQVRVKECPEGFVSGKISKGVSYSKSEGKWVAYYSSNGRTKKIGRFKDEKSAVEARNLFLSAYKPLVNTKAIWRLFSESRMGMGRRSGSGLSNSRKKFVL